MSQDQAKTMKLKLNWKTKSKNDETRKELKWYFCTFTKTILQIDGNNCEKNVIGIVFF